MGWLPWSSGESKKNEASDGGRIAPDRTSRARCWESRDLFFACLDKNDILDGIKEDKKARQKCAKEVEEFEAACSQSWVRIEFLPGIYPFVSSFFWNSGSWLALQYMD
jgi:cytochrome c oxidase assembly factor 6